MDLEAHQPLECVTSNLQQGSDVHKRGEKCLSIAVVFKIHDSLAQAGLVDHLLVLFQRLVFQSSPREEVKGQPLNPAHKRMNCELFYSILSSHEWGGYQIGHYFFPLVDKWLHPEKGMNNNNILVTLIMFNLFPCFK